MKKGMKWFKKKLDDIEVSTASLQNYDAIWMLNRVHELVVQLDEPEVLSQEWIDEHAVAVAYDGMPDETEIVYVDDLQSLLIPKQELPVIPKFVAKYLELAKSEISLMRVLEIANRRDELPKWEKEYDWISTNDEVFARAWLDGYKVEEEPVYYALMKGHELIGNDTRRYWNLDSDGIFLSDRHTVYGWKLTKMSKSEWSKVGINDSNADFVEVEEGERG